MKLFINNHYQGNVTNYYQNRNERKWIFEMENGFIISIDFDQIRLFNSCGMLDIIL